jgi:hypothetical protein
LPNRAEIYVDACSPEFRAFGAKFNQYPKGWEKMYVKCFGAKSPWSIKITSNKVGKVTKRGLFWDNVKAAKLGL